MHIDIWTIALQTVNFLVLVWLLNRFLYKPVLRLIDAREAQIRQQYDDAKAVSEKAEAAHRAVEAERAGIGAERDRILVAAAEEGKHIVEARRAQAEHDAEVLLAQGRETLENERMRARDELRQMALELGASYVRKLLAEMSWEIRPDAWIERIEQYLQALPKPERERLIAQFSNGSGITVTTATPLTADTEERWRKRLEHVLRDGISVAYKTDPALVAGVELHFPESILRFSWKGALSGMQMEETDNHADAH